MSHRYESILVHCVFSTKNRAPLIPKSMQTKLWAYIGGIARANKFKALAVGGMPDHVHALLSIPATITAAKALQLIKGGSSKWINDHLPRRSFAWQDSYGAFSIGISQVRKTIRYINTQEEHHARTSFRDEFKRFLKAHAWMNSRDRMVQPSPAGTLSNDLPSSAVETAGYCHSSASRTGLANDDPRRLMPPRL